MIKNGGLMTMFEIGTFVLGALLAFGSIPLGFSGKIRPATIILTVGFTMMMYGMLPYKLTALAYLMIQSGIFLYWELGNVKTSTALLFGGVGALVCSLVFKL